METNSSHESLKVRIGKEIMIPCPVLSEVIQLDGTFKWLSWSYCTTDTCTTTETKWSWMGGMNSQRMTQVKHKGRYAGRINLTRNGTLVLSKVQVSDSTDYRCTVQRINFTSPRIYFVTLIVNATGKRCRLVNKYSYYIRTEIYALKSHVVNFRTEVSSGQSEERTTFFPFVQFPATCVASRRPLASSIYSTRRFVLRKVVVGPKRVFPYRK